MRKSRHTRKHFTRGKRSLGMESLEVRQLLYGEPIGGWDYIYGGDAAADGSGFSALDGTWGHSNGSDKWDGSAPGSGNPGGAGIFTDAVDGATYLRLQDAGDPRDHGFPDDSNRKLFFGHDIGPEGATDTQIDDGVTVTFRTRLATGSNLDQRHPDGGGAKTSVPSTGDGYALHNGGKGHFLIRSSSGPTIGFALATTDDGAQGSAGLLMNSLNGTSTSGSVDTGEGAHNQFDVADPTQWHEFWITIQAGGSGTHQVTVYADQDLNGQTFDVTGGNGLDFFGRSYIAMAMGATDQSGAIDIDHFGWKAGVVPPVPDGEIDPAILNNSPATNIGYYTADIGGTVVESGGQNPDVTIYWGTSDGEHVPAAWENGVSMGFQASSFTTTLEGLDQDTTYYYRVAGENLGGVTWANETDSFTTLQATAATVANSPADGITAISATIGGDVVSSNGANPSITIYWGDNDGGTDSTGWDNSVDLGVQTDVFATELTGLNSDAQYFYRVFSQNDFGSSWAPTTASFRTQVLSLPALTTNPISDVGAFSASFSGAVTDEGGNTPEVTIYYGTSDGGTNAAAWQNNVSIGLQTGSFDSLLVSLAAQSTYFARAAAENAAGVTWDATTHTFTTTDAPSLLVNEVLASNGSDLSTRVRISTDGPFVSLPMSPDWIELHNPSGSTVDLSNFHLTDNLERPTRWRFPVGTTIPGNSYLVVFASGENITDPALDETGRLHTNFVLSSGGEDVALTDPGGTVVHQINVPKMNRDVSFGLDNQLMGGFYIDTTPGEENSTQIEFVGDTTFDNDRGFYDAPFEVTITSATEAATIIYTLDGSEPTVDGQNNVTHGTVYTGPIAITTTTNLRAMAFKPGMAPTNVDTHTYIFPTHVLQQDGNGLPPHRNWGHAGPDWEVDPEVVNLPADDPNRLREEDLKDIPTLSIAMEWDEMFGSNGIYPSGEGVQKPSSFEYFDPDTGDNIQQNASIEVKGGSSVGRWKIDKISMFARFQDPFGPTTLDFDIFGGEATNVFDNLSIDGQLNYVWAYGPNNTQRSQALYIHDQYAADLHNALSGPGSSPHGRFVHLYYNGVYWGMHYLHERPDDSFSSEYQGGEKEEYHAINQNRSINDAINPDGSPTSRGEAVTDLNRVVSAASAAGSGGVDEWNTLTSMLDMDNFINYLLVNWYLGNGDWGDTKNWQATRHNTPDGKWRFHSWDAEKVLENFASGGRDDVGNGPRGIHQNVKNNEEYQILFADYVQKAMFNGGILTEEGAVPYFQTRVDEIEAAIRGESARWGDNRVSNEYVRQDLMNNFQSVLDNFFPGRTEEVLGWLRDEGVYPQVGAPVFQINGSEQHGGLVSAGDTLSMVAATAVVTTDTQLVPLDAPVKAFVPSDNSLEIGAGPHWHDVGFDTTGWSSGDSGVGYGSVYEEWFGVDVTSDWSANPTSVYTRFEFDLDADFNAAEMDGLQLRLKYDDGYVVYLNGQQVHSNNAPATVDFDTRATATRSNFLNTIPTLFEVVDLTDSLNALQPGQNVLAIQVLNASTDLGDLLIRPELTLSDDVVQSAPIIYTLDGSDPRAIGGANVGITYAGSIPITNATEVNARALVNGEWSALSTADFVLPTGPEDIRITEINYNPHQPNFDETIALPSANKNDYQFIEIFNSNPTEPVSLLGLQLSNGVDFDFPSFILQPQQYAVVVENMEAFELRYGASADVIGQWNGGLSNNGETIELIDGGGSRIVEIAYNDSDPWPERTDGLGATLELTSPTSGSTEDLGKYYRWQASSNVGGTPGQSPSTPFGVVINEVRASSDELAGEVDVIELFNNTDSPKDISGWFLSDSSQDFFKFEIPAGTIMPAKSYLTFTEDDFNPAAGNGFALRSAGDDVWLVSQDDAGGVATFGDDVHFRATANSETLGRVPNAAGRLAPLAAASLGAENGPARVGPIVISELNYSPGPPSAAAIAAHPDVESDDLEFVEVHNPTSSAVDLTNWRIRGGVDLNFDDEAMIAAGETIVVISFNPDNPENAGRVAAFRAHYGIGDSVRLIGGYGGQLNNDSERVQLQRPGTPPAGELDLIRRLYEDEVLYDDLAPWPTSADGTGFSLTRTAATAYGNDATSWQAAQPSLGTVDFTSVVGDVNGDNVLDGGDLDLVCSAIDGPYSPDFDFDNSGILDFSDLETFVNDTLGTWIGDANLDRAINAVDLNQVGIHWLQAGDIGWGSGDFNCDDQVTAIDLNDIGLNWQQSNAAVRAARSPRAPLAAVITTRNAVHVDEAIRSLDGIRSMTSSTVINSPTEFEIDVERLKRLERDLRVGRRFRASIKAADTEQSSEIGEVKTTDEVFAGLDY